MSASRDAAQYNTGRAVSSSGWPARCGAHTEPRSNADGDSPWAGVGVWGRGCAPLPPQIDIGAGAGEEFAQETGTCGASANLAIALERQQLLLHLDQLLAHVHDHLDTGQVDAQVVHQALDEADLLDIGVAEAPDVATAPLRGDQAAPLVHAQALLVQAAHLGGDLDRVVLLSHCDRVT